MKTSLLIFFIASYTIIFSQKYSAYERYTFDDRFSLTWAPLSIVDPNPRIRIGIEYNLSEKNAFNVDVGFSTPFINQVAEYDGINDFYEFYEFRPQFKQIAWNGYDSRIYVAIELFISKSKREFFDSYFYPDQSNQTVSYDRAQIKRRKDGAHFIMGWQFYLADLFLMDFYAGMGFAMRRIDYLNVENGNVMQHDVEEYFLWNPYLHEGNIFIPNIALGFKVGIIQNKTI